MRSIHKMTLPLLILFFGLTSTIQAQDKSDRPSPPRTAKAQTSGGEIIIDYSSPGVKDREIWGGLVPYEEVWRTGANEATTITLENDMKVGGKLIPAGKYGLFTIPGEDEWTIILNSVWDQWGAYNYDPDKDVHRFKVTPEKVDETQERLEFTIRPDGLIVMAWENLRVPFRAE